LEVVDGGGKTAIVFVLKGFAVFEARDHLSIGKVSSYAVDVKERVGATCCGGNM